MQGPKGRTVGIALGAAALGGLGVGLAGAVSASAATLTGGGSVSDRVFRRVWQTTISWLAPMRRSPPTTTGCSATTRSLTDGR
jgi:hypothetical protein